MVSSDISEAKTNPAGWEPTRAIAVKIALSYALIGILWILGSGQLLHYLVEDAHQAAFLENLKGWFYVIVTALLLGAALDRYFQQIRSSAQRLRESEQRWQYALEGAGHGVWDWNVVTNEVFFSGQFISLLGFERHEFGHTLADWKKRVHPEELSRVWEEISRHLEGRVPEYITEYRLQCKDGTYKWILAQGRVMSRAADGKALRVLGTHSDITKNKQSEKDLHDSEERLRLAAEAAQMGTWDRDIKSSQLYWSAEQERLMGYEPGTFPGTNEAFLALIHPDSWETHKQAQQQARSGKGQFQAELRFRCRDGRERWGLLRGRTYFDAEGRPERIIGVDIDITERKRTEEALRNSEERYRGLVETTFDWIWEVDADFRYTYASPKIHSLLGYLPEEVLGRTLFDLMPEAEAQRVKALLHDKAATRAAFSTLENTNRHKDGHQVVLESSGVPMVGPANHFLGYRGMDRDITERKKLEAQLRQAQKLEAIGQLAGGVAHDFNNFLAAIMMYLGMLQLHPHLDDESKHTLEELDREARRAANLTRQLLMFSRRSVMTIKPLNLNEVVTNLLKMLSRLVGEHIVLRFDSESALPWVEADAGMMEQVVMNLVVNARDAITKGGRITIRTTATEIGQEMADIYPDRRLGRFVCLEVSDTGSGMDVATIKRIFEPFFTTKEAGKGTGLGLATVHGIVAQHQGWVEVDSQVGAGTTFRVYLPTTTPPSVAAPVAPAAGPLPRGQETILLVEDELAVRRLIGQTLRKLGYQVHEAGNGQEALMLWQLYGMQVDLLLTDMVMPEGMTGLELAEQLQSLKPSLKAIITSGYSSEIIKAGVPIQKGIGYLSKPFEAKALANRIREYLD